MVELGVFPEIGVEPIASDHVLGGRDQVDIANGNQSLDLEAVALHAGITLVLLIGGCRGPWTFCRCARRGFGLEPDSDRVNRVD